MSVELNSESTYTDCKIVLTKQSLILIRRVKFMTGLNTKDWCSKVGFSRSCMYQSACGAGARKMRVRLAFFTGKRPSEVWPDRSDRVRGRDDAAYLEMCREIPT